MKISLKWLKEYCEWDWSVSQIVEKLTMSGTEVEAIHQTGVAIENIVTAKVLSFRQHPNADRLRLCEVTDGSKTRQIVCGAKNFKEGDIVPLALPGATFPDGMVIKVGKLRGETSEGMMCSSAELGLATESDGLLLLSSDTPLGRPISELFDSDTVLEVEVTPNRPDLLSYTGIARELIALGAKPRTNPQVGKASFGSIPDWKLIVDQPEDCPRYTAQLIRGVKVQPSPDWLKTRLESIGLRSINNIVDITNYVLFEWGQPLHAFDADKLAGKQIFVRRAAPQEKFKALDGKEYQLSPDDMVIADQSVPVALAGVMGGEDTGVSDGTVNVLLESAVFKPTLVRKTSRKLQLISDSSYRFERGVDPAIVDIARQRATQLILELAGGAVEPFAGQTSEYAPKNISVALRGDRVRSFIDWNVSDERISEILKTLGCCSTDGKNWQIPSWRADLEREIDLIEEIVRIEGLDKVKGRLHFSASPESSVDKKAQALSALRSALTSLGYHEVLTTTLLSRQELGEGVQLSNPMNEDGAGLRSSLLSTVLPCIARNLSRDIRNVRVFEIGKVFFQTPRGVQEETRLLIAGTGDERKDDWIEKGREYDYFTLKGAVEALQSKFPVIKSVAKMELVDAKSMKANSIKVPVYYAELILKDAVSSQNKMFVPIPAFPSVKRDLAFVVDQKIHQADLLKAIQNVGVKELESVELFDLFEDKDGSKLGKEKKSLAYSLTYRSNERTLQENEVNAWQKAVIESVSKATGAELRK